jgi:hypothetical protein
MTTSIRHTTIYLHGAARYMGLRGAVSGHIGLYRIYGLPFLPEAGYSCGFYTHGTQWGQHLFFLLTNRRVQKEQDYRQCG